MLFTLTEDNVEARARMPASKRWCDAGTAATAWEPRSSPEHVLPRMVMILLYWLASRLWQRICSLLPSIDWPSLRSLVITPELS